MAKHNELGKIGEEIAYQHLLQNGFEILNRNWKFKKDEIDIVAKKNNVLVFVEVKTRASEFFATPADTVSMKKQKRLIKVSNYYIQSQELTNEGRFDIITIIHNDGETKLEHIEDAFYPTT